MLYDLLAHPINDTALRQPPDTDAKREVKARTLSHDERWLQDWLMNDEGQWSDRIAKRDLYERYKLSLPRSATPISIEAFGRFLRKAGLAWRECKVPSGNGYRFPSLVTCRDAFDRTFGTTTEWPSDVVDEALPM